MPVGVPETPAGALAAADNYVATGISASLDPGQLRRVRRDGRSIRRRGPGSLAAASALAQSGGPPAAPRDRGRGRRTRLESYARRDCGWSPRGRLAATGTAGWQPTQYSALVRLSLRWSGDRWQIASCRGVAPRSGTRPGRGGQRGSLGRGLERHAGWHDRALLRGQLRMRAVGERNRPDPQSEVRGGAPRPLWRWRRWCSRSSRSWSGVRRTVPARGSDSAGAPACRSASITAPAGAVAAADDYLAAEQASVERDPARFSGAGLAGLRPRAQSGARSRPRSRTVSGIRAG